MKQLCKIFSSENYVTLQNEVNEFLETLPPMTGANVGLSTSSYAYKSDVYGSTGMTKYTAIIMYSVGEIPVEHLPY